jgi:alpha-beta hydrolase superfamily lysophospholipase
VATLPPRIEYYSGCDGRRLAARRWNAADRSLAHVVVLHGVTSHGGWYDQSSEYLAAAGFDVSFLDRRGSGLNGEQMGDVEKWQYWIDDVAAYIRQDNDNHRTSADAGARTIPAILCGISWGGKLAAAVARRYPALISGVALLCPGLYSPFMPGPLKRLVLALPASDRRQQRRLRIPLRWPHIFTDTPRWQEFIAHDPLALRTITWRFAAEDRKLTRYARAAATYIYRPTLLVLAGRDRIVDNRATRRYFARISSTKTLIEYPNAAHTLEFENDPTPYFADLAAWIKGVAR